MSEAERLCRIGELICKGIHASPALFSADLSRPAPHLEPQTPAERVLEYLRRHGSASPAELEAVLNLSRSRAYRTLQQLLLEGRIESNGGRTSSVAYRLRAFDPSRN